jgi:hypothetical protein
VIFSSQANKVEILFDVGDLRQVFQAPFGQKNSVDLVQLSSGGDYLGNLSNV